MRMSSMNYWFVCSVLYAACIHMKNSVIDESLLVTLLGNMVAIQMCKQPIGKKKEKSRMRNEQNETEVWRVYNNIKNSLKKNW